MGWRLVNPAMPAQWTVSLGEGAEILADKFGIDRDRQDAFAVRSHQLAHDAWDRGALADEVAPVAGTGLERDQGAASARAWLWSWKLEREEGALCPTLWMTGGPRDDWLCRGMCGRGRAPIRRWSFPGIGRLGCGSLVGRWCRWRIG